MDWMQFSIFLFLVWICIHLYYDFKAKLIRNQIEDKRFEILETQIAKLNTQSTKGEK